VKPNLSHECVFELHKLSSNVNECKPLPTAAGGSCSTAVAKRVTTWPPPGPPSPLWMTAYQVTMMSPPRPLPNRPPLREQHTLPTTSSNALQPMINGWNAIDYE